MLGSDLVGLKYVPLFDFFAHMSSRPAVFTVLGDSYVADGAGTGVVHQSPFYGVDDYRVAVENGIFTKSENVKAPIDDSGCFTHEIPKYEGQYFKDADKAIIKDLKEAKRLISISSENHAYPFCWRSNTPLMYKTVSSWFINVESIVKNLVAANQDVNW